MAIEAFVHADRVDDAFALLVVAYSLANPYFEPSPPNSGHWTITPLQILSAIDAAEIPLDTNLLNVLIFREVRLKHVVNAAPCSTR